MTPADGRDPGREAPVPQLKWQSPIKAHSLGIITGNDNLLSAAKEESRE